VRIFCKGDNMEKSTEDIIKKMIEVVVVMPTITANAYYSNYISDKDVTQYSLLVSKAFGIIAQSKKLTSPVLGFDISERLIKESELIYEEYLDYKSDMKYVINSISSIDVPFLDDSLRLTNHIYFNLDMDKELL
jgi:hypothetical protein